MIVLTFFMVCYFYQVNHSQRLNDPPLRPWVAIEDQGTIKTAHCNCMAGLGEACSHIAASLFAIVSVLSGLKETSCTSIKCPWSQPSQSSLDGTKYMRLTEIFPQKQVPYEPFIPESTDKDMKDLYTALHQSENSEDEPVKSAILSIIPGHSQRYIPQHVTADIPKPFSAFYAPNELKNSSLTDLQEKGRQLMDQMQVTKAQVSLLNVSLLIN